MILLHTVIFNNENARVWAMTLIQQSSYYESMRTGIRSPPGFSSMHLLPIDWVDGARWPDKLAN